MAGIHALSGAFIPYDTELDVTTASTSYVTALDISGFGMAQVIPSSTGENLYAWVKITVDGNVIASDWEVEEKGFLFVLQLVWSSSFKVEYRKVSGDGKMCISYKNYT